MRTIELPERQAAMIDDLVRTGSFQDVSAVVQEGLRLLEIQASDEAVKLEAIRVALQIGLDDLERGEYEEFGSMSAMIEHLKDVGERVIAGESKA